MDGEGPYDRGQPASEAAEANPRRVVYFFTYLGSLIAAVFVLDAALLFPRHSLAYQWLNRLGIFLAVIVLFGLFVWAEWTSIRWKAEAPSPGLKWFLRALGVVLPALFAIKAWGRILQAFWLR